MVNVFSEAPSLREVDISVYTRWISLPWIQLTHLRLSKIVLSECLNILQKTLKLEVLRLSDLDGLGSNPSRPHVILPSLRTLSLSHDPDTIIEHLTLPALQTLGLRSIDIASPTRWVNIGLRSAWPLRSITTWEMAPNARDICLRSLPSLALVNIYNSNNEHDYYDSLVNLLAHDDQFLPALCSLALHSFYVIPTLPLPLKEMVEMVEMVASRWNGKRAGVSKLESFHLAVVRGAQSVKATDKLRMELLPLATEGLQVDIRIN
ncbi:hypothetical protein B0H15DRAFT_806707 [Mycena belliarum]|uniref:Uncharacterized protein n=1 Tax=Mycena belliarum TaxID=1033014 RepID=A0AAD6TSU4_9AGAR|nr:hypothetical protein B0H15DRAFT_806707 [Mycena belliae]